MPRIPAPVAEPQPASSPPGTGKRLASCSDDLTVRLWSCERGSEIKPAGVLDATLHERTIYSVDWSPDGCVCQSCTGPISGLHAPLNQVSSPLWRLVAASGRPRRPTCPLARRRFVATGAADDFVRIFESGPEEGQWALAAKAEHGADVNCVAWNPKEPGLLATAADDFSVRLWRIEPEVGVVAEAEVV